MLLSSLATPLPRLPFGTLGAQFAIGGLFLIHIALVGFILAATGIAPFMELAGRRRQDEMCLRYARGLSKAILYLYSLGATWAVLAVFVMAGLYGRLIGTLLNELLLPLTIAFASFFVGIPLLLLYVYCWDRFSPRIHLTVGFAFAAVQYVFLFTIVELDSYVLTPGTAVSAVGAAFSPSYPWLLLHYAGANLSWAPLLLAGIAVWRGRRAKSAAEITYQRWAARISFAIGSIFLLAQPITGFLLAETVKTSSLPAFDNLFVLNSASLFIGQVALLAVLVIGANLVFWRHKERTALGGGGAGPLTVVALLGMAGTALPSAVLPPNLVALRYVALLIAFLATAVNLAGYLRSLHGGALAERIDPLAARVMGVVGVCALVLTLYMGVIKENAKLPCGIDANTGQDSCLLSLPQSAQNFTVPKGYQP
ncbi:MAG TPA: cytochrome ubiquinol oxidase subunit I [Candidatus Dormibacteraeota bacterium]|nr:cytochrome ubiquinol oxidase subunit I [Candidatus Dormibacteraeota bacterium]